MASVASPISRWDRPAQGLGRVLDPDGEALHAADEHRRRGGEVRAFLVGDDGADDGILELGFVEIDLDVDLLAADELDDGVAGPLGQRPVRPAGEGPVEIADVDVGQLLPRRVMEVDFGIGPLVERIGPAVAHAELLTAPGRRDGEVRRIGPAEPGRGRGAPVGRQDDEDPSPGERGVLGEDPGREAPRRLLGMGAAEEEDRPAGLFPLEDVDVGVVLRAPDRREIIPELDDSGKARARYDGLAEVPAPIEAHPGRDGQDRAERRDGDLAYHLILRSRRRNGMRTMM